MVMLMLMLMQAVYGENINYVVSLQKTVKIHNRIANKVDFNINKSYVFVSTRDDAYGRYATPIWQNIKKFVVTVNGDTYANFSERYQALNYLVNATSNFTRLVNNHIPLNVFVPHDITKINKMTISYNGRDLRDYIINMGLSYTSNGTVWSSHTHYNQICDHVITDTIGYPPVCSSGKYWSDVINDCAECRNVCRSYTIQCRIECIR